MKRLFRALLVLVVGLLLAVAAVVGSAPALAAPALRAGAWQSDTVTVVTGAAGGYRMAAKAAARQWDAEQRLVDVIAREKCRADKLCATVELRTDGRTNWTARALTRGGAGCTILVNSALTFTQQRSARTVVAIKQAIGRCVGLPTMHDEDVAGGRYRSLMYVGAGYPRSASGTLTSYDRATLYGVMHGGF